MFFSKIIKSGFTRIYLGIVLFGVVIESISSLLLFVERVCLLG